MKSGIRLLMVIASILAAGQAVSDEAVPGAFERPSENIALGVPYVLEPAPAYEDCMDPDDAKQLTDGVYSEGHFWVQKSTVGWKNAKPVVVILDLGSVKSVRGVSYRSAAGTAGVEWPTKILILVADAVKQFHEAGDLVALSARKGLPPSEGYATHRFWTDELQTHGRYIAFVVWEQTYIFVDEIEVYAGDPGWLERPLQGDPIADVREYGASLGIRSAIERRLMDDIAAIRKSVAEETPPKETREAINADLDDVTRATADLPTHYGNDFRAVLPLNGLHARVFQARARLWQAEGLQPFAAWVSGLWDPLSHMAEPPHDAKAALRVDLMKNEYRAAAFNVSNATQDDAVFTLQVQGLAGGVNPPYVAVHEVAWTDTNEGRPVAAALPLAERKDDAYLIRVPSGLTRQVWLTFHPKDIDAGDHQGKIELEKQGTRIEVPVTLRIYPLTFPERPALHFGGWDYTDLEAMYGVTPRNRAALVAHLKEHFVDSPSGMGQTMPFGKYDDAGHMSAPPDTSHFDAWFQLWEGARQYGVFLAVGNQQASFPMGSPEFEAAVKAWAAFWAGYVQEKGLKPEQIAVLLVDEPRSLEQDAVILDWAKAIRAADSGLRIWEDPIYKDMSKANQETIRACHVLCPNRQIFLSADQEYRDYFVRQRESGTTLEFYSCSGPVRSLDPYSYHRLQAWTCWEYGATASHFWAFGDTGKASSWNEYGMAGSSYTPLFLDDTSVTAGKHLEACREGIEDYEYLLMLNKAVEESSKKGVTGPALDRACGLLNDAPKRVKASAKNLTFRWHNEILDRSVADKVRVEILEALVALANAK